MKVSCTTLLIFAMLGVAFCQETPSDSVLNRLNLSLKSARSTGDSTEVGQLLLEKGKVFQKKRDYPTSLGIYQQAVRSIKGMEIPAYATELYFRAGMAVFFLKSIPLTQRPEVPGFADSLDRAYFQQALGLAVSNQDSVLIARSYEYLGKVAYVYERDMGGSLAATKQALIRFALLEDTSKLIGLHMNTGAIYYLMSKKDSTIYHTKLAYGFLKSRFPKSTRDSSMMGQISHNLGSLYMELRDYEQARMFLEKSLKIRSALSEFNEVAVAALNMAQLNMAENNLAEARRWAEESLEICDNGGDPRYRSNIMAVLIELDIQEEKYESALERLSWKEKFNLDSKEYNWLALAYNQKASIFKLQGKLDSALFYVDKAMATTPKEFVLQSYQDHLNLKYEIHKDRGEFDLALANFEEAAQIKDSLFTARTQELLTEERVKQNIEDYQIAKENAELEARLQATQKERYVILAIGLMCVLGILGFAFLRIRSIQQQLKAQNIQLQRLDATKNKFFSMIAHDIRSPLVALNGIGEQLDFYLKKGDSERLHRFTETVDSTTDRLSRLLDNLLNWALIQTETIPYSPEEIEVREIVEDCLALYASTAETKNIQLHNEVPEHTRVYADETALRTIIRNLVSNGLKFTNDGGFIRVSSQLKDNQLALTVADNGVGIAANKQIQLFELQKKSATGTAGEKGTGLGLILCNELAKLNQGMIEVTSELGKGSQFEVRLPVVG
ncbi:MAG: tetratricopeptide repeat-containing sensor histidine kinase [Bacteroidota bacterium]